MKLKHLRIANCSRISDIDIEMRDNVVLIGPNGSGKTTVLLCLDMLLGMDDQHLHELVSESFVRNEAKPLTVEAVLDDLDAAELATFSGNYNSAETNGLVIKLEASTEGDAVNIVRSFPACNAQSNAFGWTLLQAEASPHDNDSGQKPIPRGASTAPRSPFAAAISNLLATGANIIAIDEPEAHLHPSSQRSLAKKLKASGGQKILVTHSPTIAGSFEPDEIVVIRADGTASQSRRDFLSGNASMLARWWIGRQLEPLTAGTVIAVEGPSDRIIVDAVASALGFDLDGHDVVVMETNGCGDMKVVESIFGSGGFDIPLYELIDEDAMDDAVKRLDVDADDLEAHSVFVSTRDLEDEYVRAIGAKRLWTRMKETRTFTRNVFSLCRTEPDGFPTEASLAEFIRSKSNRKIPAALLAAELIDETNACDVSSVARLLEAAWS